MKVWDENKNFLELLSKDADITSHLSPRELEAAFTLDTYLRNVGAIFDRVFGSKKQ
jgi:adenylosuccinate lyase